VLCDEIIQTIFECIFLFECFHSLEYLLITEVDGSSVLLPSLCQLATCEWVFSTHCLKELGLRSCHLDVVDLLRFVSRVDTGIQELDLSGNCLSKPLNPREIPGFHSIRRLFFGQFQFGVRCVESILNCLS
jgi:hypothetical protein